MGARGSIRQQQTHLSAELRDAGKTWVEIAEIFREQFKVNPRAAFRLARNWSQQRAAEEWNARWPGEPKTLKSFSYWESWPGRGGHAPSSDNLVKLAQLFECSVGDLLADQPSFRHLDVALGVRAEPEPPAASATANQTEGLLAELLGNYSTLAIKGSSFATVDSAVRDLVRRIEEIDLIELARVIIMWMHRQEANFARRDFLGNLNGALALAAAAPLLSISDFPDGGQFGGLDERDAIRFEPHILSHCEGMILQLRRCGAVLGARLALPGALAYQRAAAGQAKVAPAAYKARGLSAYAELTQVVGWFCFNIGDYATAQHHYDVARVAAHEARNAELVSYVLSAMSQLASWQGRP